MNLSSVKLTDAVVHDRRLWFSAYEFGWGFRAFEIAAEVARSELGASDLSSQQLTLAFELGRSRIAKTVEAMSREYDGERILLQATDLRA